MENRKSIGLPGGPNEFLKEITQYISVEGYKRYSEDVNNPYNIIESGNITMEDVDFPVMGTDNLGNEQMMMPGMNYQFPGDQVFEVPMAQYGEESSLSRDEIFNIPRSVRYEDSEMVLQDKPIWDGFLDEATVTPYTQSELAFQERMADKATGGIKPVYPLFEIMTAGLKAPATAGAKAIEKSIKKTIKKAPSKINPKYYNPNTLAKGDPSVYYRKAGEDAFDDFQKSGILRTRAEVTDNPIMGLLDTKKEMDQVRKSIKEAGQFTYRHPSDFRAPYFSRGRAADIIAKDDYLFQTRPGLIGDDAFTSGQMNILHGYGKSPMSPGGSGIMDPMQRGADNFDVFKKSWWHGYKPIKQDGGETLPTAQNGREQATISAYEEPAWYEKAVDYLASPMTSLGYLARGQDLPDRIPINVEDRNTYDMIIDMINPAAWYAYAESADRNISEGNYTDAAFDVLGAIPVVPAWLAQGKNATKAGKNVIKNAAKYTDEVFASSDDIAKTTLKDAKPRATRFDAVTEVNPLSQAQARNLAEQGRNAEIFKAFEEGANTIDDFVKSYTGDLSSPDGFKRLVQQEADYLRSIGFDEARIATQAEINAGARLNEIINIGNRNKAIVQGERSAESIVKKKNNFNNASYTPATLGDSLDDLFYKPGTDISNANFAVNKTKTGAKVLPGNVNLGTMFNSSKPIAAHEIGGHGLQSGRSLPVDSRLKKLEPLDELNDNAKAAYNYFLTGSKGREPSAFLHELRQAMLDNKLIKNRYDYVSPEQLQRFQTLFDLRPSGTANTMADKFHSNTRILDFMKPTQSNFDLLARELNKLPAMVPIGVAGAAGAAALPQEKYGGQLPKAQTGNGEYKVKSGDTFYGIANRNNISWKDLKASNPDLNIDQLKLNQIIKLPSQPVVQNKVQPVVQKPVQKKVEEAQETTWGDYLNPMNWGVSDRDDDGTRSQAFRAARIAGEDEFMWHGKRYTTELAPTVEEPVLSKDLIYKQTLEEYKKDLMLQENGNKEGWDSKKQLWFPIKAPEKGGGYDIGYGHKISKGEDYSKGLTNKQVQDLMISDYNTKKTGAEKIFNNQNLDRKWKDLTPQEQILLTDYNYNGVLPEFKKFMEAIASKDKDSLLREFKRYSIVNGTQQPLGSRNDWTKSYIENKIDYKAGGELNPLIIYSNYVNGDYNNTPREKKASYIYDKLNRIHYRDAKSLGMSPANYILTHVIGKA